MKKIKTQNTFISMFLVILCFLFSMSCSKSDSDSGIDKSTRPDLYTYVPDNNFEQLLIDQGHDDRLDNYITTSDVADVTLLLFTSGFDGTIAEPSGISNFTGIEAFISLEQFDCSSLNLTSIDLSNNTALKSLNCSDNSLTNLDLSNLTELEVLSCGYNNLTSLELNSEALTYLSCHENDLPDLDIASTNSLEGLTCFNNNLTSLDISSNVSLITLQASNNLFETLDISQNIALTYIECHYNPLLTCIKVNENQLTQTWSFCSSELFSLSCE